MLPIKVFDDGGLVMFERHCLITVGDKATVIKYEDLDKPMSAVMSTPPQHMLNYVKSQYKGCQKEFKTEYLPEQDMYSTHWADRGIRFYFSGNFTVHVDFVNGSKAEKMADLLLEVTLYNRFVSQEQITIPIPLLLLDRERIAILAEKEFVIIDRLDMESPTSYYYEELMTKKFEDTRELIVAYRTKVPLYSCDNEFFEFSSKESKIAITRDGDIKVIKAARTSVAVYSYAFAELTQRWCTERK